MTDGFNTAERLALRAMVRTYAEQDELPELDSWERAGELIGALAVTEPDGGSDVGGIRTTAKRDGADYIVNGSKTYITSGCRADFVVAAVRTGDSGARGVSLVEIEKGTPGFTVSRKLEKMGWLASDTAELSFADCRVPVANLVGHENTGFAQVAQHFLAERLMLAVQAYASAQRSLDLTVEWCRNRNAEWVTCVRARSSGSTATCGSWVSVAVPQRS
jgi:acyl-CoA dehydrogenase